MLKSRLLQGELSKFEAALDTFADDAAFEHASAIIARSRRRFILGRGNSQGYASVLTAALKPSFSQVLPVASPGIDHLDLLSDVRSNDVLVIICVRPYRRDTVEIGKLYVAAGGTLVLVTDSTDSPLSAFASEQIIIETESPEAGETSTPMFLAIRLLSELSSATSKGALRRSQERNRLGTLLDLHVPDMRWLGRGPEPHSGGGME